MKKQKPKEPVKRILNKKPSTGKPKELDCWLKITGETSEHFVTALQFDFESEKSYKEAVRYFKESFELALTQQRKELENQKVKVVWNNVCEQIKQEVRTELLEDIKGLELKHSINPNSPSRERKIIYNEAINDVIRLLNKKDE